MGGGGAPNSNATERWMPQVTSFCLRMKYAGETLRVGRGGSKAKGEPLVPLSRHWFDFVTCFVSVDVCMHVFVLQRKLRRQ